MLLESFVIHKALVDKVLLRILKFEHAFCYSNLHQMFSILLWALTLLEILSFATNHYATSMQLVIVCNYLGNVCNYKFGIV
jgi:hypothetical protein